METYHIENLTFTYPGRERPALDHVCLSVERGAFVTLCGPSGCGKTTLLRQLKPLLAPHGDKSGAISFEGAPLDSVPQRLQSAKIGFIRQSPENQIVTDKVWHELAFGLESLGFKTPEIRLRVAEMASFFGIQAWFDKNIAELSGGQKQLLCLASVMAAQPSVLILDEPTSQLDPIAAAEFLAAVGKLNRELGVTVLLTEHRLEEAFPMSDRVVAMDGGRLIADGSPRDVGLALRGGGHGMFLAMPAAMRVWAGVPNNLPCPVTVRDGRAWLGQMPVGGAPPPIAGEGAERRRGPAAVELDGVWFRYEKEGADILKGLTFQAFPGELTAILGGNGTGKTTALSLVARLHTPYRGKVRINGAEVTKIPRLFDGLLGVLPQNPQTLFIKKTVREDLSEILAERGLSKGERQARLAHVAALCRLSGLLDTHPYDLSDGEQQRAALAKVLLLRPQILLLDEPTKGLDAEFKRTLAKILKNLTGTGVTVVMVSHDVEFCAEHADRCAMLFDGVVVSDGSPREFFSGNSFYTTSVNRMARDVFPDAVTVNDVIAALGGEPESDEPESGGPDLSAEDVFAKTPAPSAPAPKLSVGRKIAAGISICLLIAGAALMALHFSGFTAFLSGGSAAVGAAAAPADMWLYVGLVLAVVTGFVGLVLALGRDRGRPAGAAMSAAEKRKLRGRTIAAAVVILLAIPLTIYVGTYFFGGRKYYFISLLIILETLLPFALVFERRRPQARELVVIAVLCGLAVAGRSAFFMLPQFKPVVALVVLSGVAFGGETGFLVGAMTGFVSNMFFGQGPWTPWQMFAFGIIGFLAGAAFRKGLLRRARVPLAVFGGIMALAVYGGVMNLATVLMVQANPTKTMLGLAYLQGLPFDLIHAAATVFFLLILSRPILEKLDRIKLKYGLIA